jgi:hypothetical protein
VRRVGAGTSRAKGPWGSTYLTGIDDELGGRGSDGRRLGLLNRVHSF